MTRRLLVLLVVVAVLGWLFVSSGKDLARLDYTAIPERATWQLTSRVIDSLGLQPGHVVADIGAGDGYFVPSLATAVGPTGRVFAVEVEDHLVRRLERQAQVEDLANVEVILGELDDPRLPARGVDLVFLCNTYHHIERRTDYFAALRADLKPGGRVAVIDMRSDLQGVARLFAQRDHWMERQTLLDEMDLAGYRHVRSYDYLPVQIFEVFTPR